MNRRTVSTIAGAALGAISAVLVLAGLAHAQRADEVREEFHQTYPLAAGGRVELANVNGDVNISGWDTNEVKIDAVKRARSADRLSECKIVIDSHPDSIRISTEYPDHDSWFGHRSDPATVDYTIKVPRAAQLNKISLVNGGLTITGVSGSVRASAVNGRIAAGGLGGPVDLSSVNSSVEATLTSPEQDARLHSVNGRVVLTVPSDTRADISASTVNGGIHNDFGLGIEKGRFVGSKLRGRLGSGAAHIDLSTVNGSIELRHANDGKPVSKATDLSERHSEPI